MFTLNQSITCSTMDASLPNATPHSSSLVITALPSLTTTLWQCWRSERNAAARNFGFVIEMCRTLMLPIVLARDCLAKMEWWMQDEKQRLCCAMLPLWAACKCFAITWFCERGDRLPLGVKLFLVYKHLNVFRLVWKSCTLWHRAILWDQRTSGIA